MTPTASDLRAAAERVRRVNIGESYRTVYQVDSPDEADILERDDLYSLGHAHADYLASQPADGEEAITEETEFVKFTDKLGLQCRWRLLHSEDGYVFVWHQAAMMGGYPIDWNDIDEYDAVNILVTTDNDVRRICGVLGITLREGKE